MSDMAEGLCARLYSARGTLADAALCPPCVSGKELAKVRDKLEKSFPETADLSKVSLTHSLTHSHPAVPSLMCRCCIIGVWLRWLATELQRNCNRFDVFQ
jgi:hypothetical protein